MSKKYLRDLVPLVVICLIAALLLASFNLLTKGPISENTLRAAQETRARMLPAAVSFEETELKEDSNMDSCYQGLDAAGEPVGYVIQTTVNGYGGEVVVTMGLDNDNVITGVDVGGENFSETPGLGALAKEPKFTEQFIGKKVPLKLVKGNEPRGEDTVDAISGATRTSSAVNGGINLAGKYIVDLSGGSSPNTASAQGFGGPVAVTLELGADGAISSIVIGDDYFNETDGYGKRALEEAYWSQFIGMTPPLAFEDTDAISGATVTSKAVVNAINTVYGQLTGAEAPAVAEDESPAAMLYDDGAWRASAKGFGGEVAVKLVLDGMTITEMEVGDADFAETEGFGSKARDTAFTDQFIGKTLPLTASDVDTIAGATITSNAVLDAIDAIHQALTDDVPDEVQPYVADKPEAPDKAAFAVTVDGNTYSASSKGFGGPVAVKLTLNGTTIEAISIGDNQFNETEYFGEKALEADFQNQFIGKTLPLTIDDIDAISGATITTNAVLDAIDMIYREATGVPASAPAAPEVTVDGNTYAASSKGFGGPVAVKLTLNGNAIEAISIGDNQFNETEYFGEKALEADFQNQFIGKTLPLTIDDIDAISGATITTNAVLDAIDQIAQVAVPVASVADDAAVTEAASPSLETASATAPGFNGPVKVTLTLDGMTIKGIEIGDEQFAETEGLGSRVQREAFLDQFIGKTLPLAENDIDAISGVTVTSTAVMRAIDHIYLGLR